MQSHLFALDEEIWFDISGYNNMTAVIFMSVQKDINSDELQPRLDNFLDN